MTKAVLLASAAVFALSVGGVVSANAHNLPTAHVGSSGYFPIHTVTPGKKKKGLYNQNSNYGSDAVDSQNFESTFAAYDNTGADDFTVPSGKTWSVKSVSVSGQYFNGSGPASSENVTIYADNGGVPGATVASFTNAKGKDSSGSFVIKTKGLSLTSGTYWLGVVANCSFSGGCGEWGWDVNTKLHGNQAMWENPNGGFGVCPSWGTIETCVGSPAPDFMFALSGKSS
jgi:hypothetical protein